MSVHKLTFVNIIKYLGVLISHDLRDDEDLVRHKRYLYAKGNMLVNNFKQCSDTVKQQLFKTFCYSMYGTHLWTSYNCKSLDKVKVAFNDVYRMLFNVKRGDSMSQIYVNNGIDSFYARLRMSSYGFMQRLYKSSNSIISKLISSIYFMCYCNLTISWNKTLFL